MKRLIMVALMGGGSVSSAEASCDTNPNCGEDISKSISTIVGIAAGASTLTGVGITMTTSKNNSTEAYLKDNNKAIRKAIALGHGDALEDLLKFYNIKDDQRERAIEALKQNRKDILEKIALENMTSDRAKEADRYLRATLKIR
jgi:hypothetical protein